MDITSLLENLAQAVPGNLTGCPPGYPLSYFTPFYGIDITRYKRIVVVLNETIRLMGEIDKVIEEYGGWPRAFANGQEKG